MRLLQPKTRNALQFFDPISLRNRATKASELVHMICHSSGDYRRRIRVVLKWPRDTSAVIHELTHPEGKVDALWSRRPNARKRRRVIAALDFRISRDAILAREMSDN